MLSEAHQRAHHPGGLICCGLSFLAQAHVLALQLAVALAVAAFVCLMRPAQLPTYLVDFYCYRPPDRSVAAYSCSATLDLYTSPWQVCAQRRAVAAV